MAELNDRTVRESSLNTLRKMMDAPRKKTERKKNLNKLISVLIKELKQDLKENNSQVNNKKVKIIQVNCEEEQSLAKKYDISGYPTFKLLTGKEIVEYDGGVDREQFMDFLKENV